MNKTLCNYLWLHGFSFIWIFFIWNSFTKKSENINIDLDKFSMYKNVCLYKFPSSHQFPFPPKCPFLQIPFLSHQGCSSNCRPNMPPICRHGGTGKSTCAVGVSAREWMISPHASAATAHSSSNAQVQRRMTTSQGSRWGSPQRRRTNTNHTTRWSVWHCYITMKGKTGYCLWDLQLNRCIIKFSSKFSSI